MTSISWPIRLSGDYSDGTVCNAADYKNDFGKLRDAVNQLYERFGSYRLSANIRRPMGFYDSNASGGDAATGLVFEYMSLADQISAATSFAQEAATSTADMNERRVVRTLIQVPTWMQGVRIRGIQAVNTSQFPYSTAEDGVEFRYYNTAPTFGVSVGNDIEDFDFYDADSTSFNSGSGAVDVQTVVFGTEDGQASADALNDVNLHDNGAGQTYTSKNYVAGPNYSTFATSTRHWRPVMKASTADYVVEPGQFIGLWCAGSVKITNETGGDLIGPMFLEYSWDVLLDAMIPIP
tara:strand:- start:214 stop:1092 length:879 start_codon:yes stop_codon:yes gene_type:complete